MLETTIADVVNVKCKGDSTGAINLNIKGGTAPYTYEWSNGKSLKDNSGIGAGSYNVKIIDSKACVNTLSATVTEPSELYATLDKATNIDCFGDHSGAIDVSVGGGIPPYIYHWSNNATTQNLVGIEAGEFVLNVKDQNGCESELKTTIEQNNQLSLSVQEVTHVLCNGLETGAAVINVAGGVEPYSFRWSDGSESKDLNNVKANLYRLNITDARLCATSLDVAIEEPSPVLHRLVVMAILTV